MSFTQEIINEFLFIQYSSLILANFLTLGYNGQILQSRRSFFKKCILILIIYLSISIFSFIIYTNYPSNILLFTCLSFTFSCEHLISSVITKIKKPIIDFLATTTSLMLFALLVFLRFPPQFTFIILIVSRLLISIYILRRFIVLSNFYLPKINFKLFTYSFTKGFIQYFDRVLISSFFPSGLISYHLSKLYAEPVKFLLERLTRTLQSYLLSSHKGYIFYIIKSWKIFLFVFLMIFLYSVIIYVLSYNKHFEFCKNIDYFIFIIFILFFLVRSMTGIVNSTLFKNNKIYTLIILQILFCFLSVTSFIFLKDIIFVPLTLLFASLFIFSITFIITSKYNIKCSTV